MFASRQISPFAVDVLAQNLPNQIALSGAWTVGLTEIQIPLTLQHLGPDLTDRMISFFPSTLDNVDDLSISYLPAGVYNTVDSLLDEINNIDAKLSEHLEFVITSGQYVKIRKICECGNNHFLILSKKLKKILGIEMDDSAISIENKYHAAYPANILNGLPSYMMIYTNILEYHVTGNVQTPLLRALTLNLDQFKYGSFQVKNFSPPMYLPVLLSAFRNIEIDIRDQFGKPIPFDYGTLTVTLHFKRSG